MATSQDKGFVVLTRELLADLLELLDAEVEAARDEVASVWRGSWAIPLCFSLALFLLFWVVALLGYALVALLSRWLPPWGAGLVVAGGFLLLAGAAAAVGVARLKRLRNPYDIFVRRLREHLAWWRSEVQLRRREPGAPQPSSTASGQEGRPE